MMGNGCRNDWKKRSIGMILAAVGLGMLLAFFLPGCAFFIGAALVCGGGWLIYIS